MSFRASLIVASSNGDASALERAAPARPIVPCAGCEFQPVPGGRALILKTRNSGQRRLRVGAVVMRALTLARSLCQGRKPRGTGSSEAKSLYRDEHEPTSASEVMSWRSRANLPRASAVYMLNGDLYRSQGFAAEALARADLATCQDALAAAGWTHSDMASGEAGRA